LSVSSFSISLFKADVSSATGGGLRGMTDPTLAQDIFGGEVEGYQYHQVSHQGIELGMGIVGAVFL
jgi:hypothetical protein